MVLIPIRHIVTVISRAMVIRGRGLAIGNLGVVDPPRALNHVFEDIA